MTFLRLLPHLAAIILIASAAHAQRLGPDVTSWILNTTGATGHDNIPSNVQQVRYSDANVYVSCTCIPGYDIGPWPGNPNQARNQNFVFKITRTPQRNTGAPIQTPLGHIGVWTNGVSIYNAKDARSYNNANIWYQNAIIVEGPSFDTCLGHPAQNGEYHHHLNPHCLYDDRDSSRHSPLIGYAFDGYPIYGAFGFRNPDGSGGIARMRSSYRLRSITARQSRPDGTMLQPSQYGPAISAQYPLGYYIEDYEYVQGHGDLDEHNGRMTITPEYPEGTYAYFVTLDEGGEAAYPYVLGPTYYGTVPAGNTGPGSGHNTPSEPVITYTLSGVDAPAAPVWSIYPNPAIDALTITTPSAAGPWRVALYDILGNTTGDIIEMGADEAITVRLAGAPSGLYIVKMESKDERYVKSVMVTR